MAKSETNNKRIIEGLLGVVFLMVISSSALAQKTISDFQGLPFISNYEASEYQAGIQNWDIVQDDLDRIYVANNLGLLEFDGKAWRRYGLNNTKVRSALWHKDGRIYVGSQADFGFLESDSFGKLSYVSLADSLPSELRNFDEAWKIFAQNDHVYFCTFERIYSYDGERLKALDFGKRLDISFQVNQQILTQVAGEGLFRIVNDGFEPVLGGEFFKDKRISNILPFNRDEWLITTFSHGIFRYNGKISEFEMDRSFWKNEYLINYSVRLKNGNIALGTQNSGLFVINEKGELLHHLDKNSGLMDLTINYIFEDSQKSLWLAMNNGLARVDLLSPFTLVDDRMDLAGSGYAALKKGEVVYLGTNNGLFIWQNGKIEFVSGTEGQVYGIQDIEGLVVLNHHNGTFIIQGNRSISVSEKQGSWILKKIPNHPNLYIQGSYTGLSLVELKNGQLQFIREIPGFDESSRVMEFDGETLWVAHGYKGVFRIRFNSDFSEVIESKLYNSAQGFPNDVLINVYQVANRLIFTANGGFYTYDAEKDFFFPYDEFNDLFRYGTVIADLEADELGNIYFIEQSQLGVIKLMNNNQRELQTKSFNKIKRFWNDDLANVIVLDHQEILIGGKQGFVLYSPQMDLVQTDLPKVFFREITNQGIQSQVIFSGHKWGGAGDDQPKFDFAQNSFLFEFASPHYESDGQIEYQVMLENYDEDWSPWSSEYRKEYTNLREGEYVFKVRAKNVFDQVSEPITYAFKVRPPIYRSLAAYTLYTILVGVLLFMGFRLLDKRHQKQTQALELEKNKALKRKDDEMETLAQQSAAEIMSLKNAKLQAEIDFKNQELTSSAMHLIQKNKLLQTIKNSLSNLATDEKNKMLSQQLNRLIKSIDKDLEGGEEWSQFAENFDQVHGNFITRLKERFPDLTPQEIKFSAYIRMNLNTKEIANLLGISVRGVEIGRYRVRKKLGLSRQDNLSDFLLRF
ncbi:triple tyrosine motif-containing protein [Algoriphagus sanaruensis]|uniref:Two component regulator three Y domain-containing protein n=1 Tax=Algoriphagus sanaruensis TaxID=1727163 RepID=A0A142ELB3_9BACT|nr:triple tyrosine motif-containing protein [Algoriphagus sanaruensis]AMQ55918.1 hypothetical protein AO498_05805 [Algoriphagus sanaruensis]